MVKNYYKLHGYPQNNQTKHNKQNPPAQHTKNPHFNRNTHAYNSNPNYNYKRVAGNVHATPVDSLFNEGDNQMKKDIDDNVSLSREQYPNVMTMLHHFQVNNAGAVFSYPLNPHLDCEDTYVPIPYSNDHESVSVMDTRSSLDTALQPAVNTSIVHTVEDPIFTRKSSRTHKAPAYLYDYHCLTNIPKQHTHSLYLHALFSNNHHITPDAISPDSQFLLQNVCHDCEPLTYEEATINPAWQAAMT
ncbi:hypothetical protein H5410_040140 [Solanum commersonii]|uniref:Uncharacterized protein n=1 Tax=Solanum commersonii TaxID=4109 RepID=A0A9J5XP84_SOLCO|nr:hypothetical protein H5410_040140 [Solanum commersonii]